MYDISDYARTYDATVTSLDMAELAGIMGMMAGLGAVTWIISLAISIFSIVTMWKVYVKAGKPGWACLIPVYNLVVLFQIAGMNPLLILLFLIPFVNFVAIPVLMIMLYIKLAKAFGKSGGFAVGLLFLNVIFMAILAFSDAEYQGV